MDETENQADRNDKEWRRAENWIGPRWLGLYHAPQDSRNWVPKPIRWLGWTVNLGQRGGRSWAVVVVMGMAGLAVAALQLV